jgi:hypothetical protein
MDLKVPDLFLQLVDREAQAAQQLLRCDGAREVHFRGALGFSGFSGSDVRNVYIE